MMRKAVRVSWWIAALLAVGVFIASIPAYAITIRQVMAESTDPTGNAVTVVGYVLSVLVTMVDLILAGVLFWRRSDDRMALFISFIFLLTAVGDGGPLEFLADLYPSWMWAYSLNTALIAPLTVLFFGLFPSGRFVPSWYRWLIPIIIILGMIIVLGLSPSSLQDSTAADAVIWVALMGIGGYAQFYRYRYVSTPSEHQQTKWLLFGFALWALCILILLLITSRLALAEEGVNLAPYSSLWWLQLSAFTVFSIARLIAPVGLAIAILHSRLWDIDIIIRRTVQYSLVSAVLVAIYVGSITLIQGG